MKTKEFVKDIEALGYEVSYSWGTIYIKQTGFAILDLGYVEEWDIDIDYPGFDGMLWDDKKELMSIVSEYMLTDPKEREEEKRYWLRLTAPVLTGVEVKYLNKFKELGKYTISTKEESPARGIQTIFTESEIEDMDITGFEKVEVTEC